MPRVVLFKNFVRKKYPEILPESTQGFSKCGFFQKIRPGLVQVEPLLLSWFSPGFVPWVSPNVTLVKTLFRPGLIQLIQLYFEIFVKH